MTTAYPLTIFYESDCPLCNAEMTNLRLRDTRGLLRFEDVSAAGFERVPPATTREALLEAIHAQRADGTVVKGVDAFVLAYRAVGLGWVAAAAQRPLVHAIADRAYAGIARNRHRFPRVIVRLLFERVLRRSAERAARRARCESSVCKPIEKRSRHG